MRWAIVFMAVLGVLLGACDTGGGSGPEPTPKPTPAKHLSGKFIRWEPVDDAHGYAYFSVTNHGNKVAVAECTISVENDFGNFGFDYLVGERIKPGKTLRGRVPLDVGEGSFSINRGEVKDC
jgi:hypothetical protein